MLTPCPACGTPALSSGCPHCGGGAGTSAVAKSLGSAVMLLGLSACFGSSDGQNDSVVAAEYGVPDSGYLDADQDGYPARNDCDDDDDTVYPGAPETAGDGVDSNCDGEDDT